MPSINVDSIILISVLISIIVEDMKLESDKILISLVY